MLMLLSSNILLAIESLTKMEVLQTWLELDWVALQLSAAMFVTSANTEKRRVISSRSRVDTLVKMKRRGTPGPRNISFWVGS